MGRMCRVYKYSKPYIIMGEPPVAYRPYVGTIDDVGKIVDGRLILADALTKETDSYFSSICISAVDIFETNIKLCQHGVTLINEYQVYGENRYLYMVNR